MIYNLQFENDRGLLISKRLIKPRRSEIAKLRCADCAFHSHIHYEGEEGGADCFKDARPGDHPFTCMNMGKSLFDEQSNACDLFSFSPFDQKIYKALTALDQSKNI